VGFAGVLISVCVAAAAPFARRLGRVAALLAAAASLAAVALLAANVFAEDDYVSAGSSRWETRGASAHLLFILEVVLCVVVAAGFVVVAFRPRSVKRVGPMLTMLAVLQAIGAWIVLVAFNSN